LRWISFFSVSSELLGILGRVLGVDMRGDEVVKSAKTSWATSGLWRLDGDPSSNETT
jgi:hypothetical protein